MANAIQLMVLLLLILVCFGRKHKIDINNDNRKYISVSTFGFYKGGYLSVNLINFVTEPTQKSDVFGFSLFHTEYDIINPYLGHYQENCFLKQDLSNQYDTAVIYFTFNFYSNMIVVRCSPGWKQPLHLYKNAIEIPSEVNKSNIDFEDKLVGIIRNADGVTPLICADSLSLESETINNITYYNANFIVYMASDSEEGLYNLYFHSCPNYVPENKLVYNFTMEVVEQNTGSYLSAGEMPLPLLYCIMAVLFFLTGSFWVFLLLQWKYPVFKIHHFMTALIFIKSISLLLQGINYHYIEIKGIPVVTWSALYYVAHLLKGVLLFATITLISMGWTFIKPALSFREKMLLVVIFILKTLSNVSYIKFTEIDKTATEYRTWRIICLLFDLACCIFILVPIVWNLMKLRKAPPTSVNLRNKKLFKYFYVMLICYIYFSRIIVYLLAITLPFKYYWMQPTFLEVTMYIFFVVTAYTFRPEEREKQEFRMPSAPPLEDTAQREDLHVSKSVSPISGLQMTQNSEADSVQNVSALVGEGKMLKRHLSLSSADSEELTGSPKKRRRLKRLIHNYRLSESRFMQIITCASAGIGIKHGAFIAEVTEEEKDALLLEKDNSHEYD